MGEEMKEHTAVGSTEADGEGEDIDRQIDRQIEREIDREIEETEIDKQER